MIHKKIFGTTVVLHQLSLESHRYECVIHNVNFLQSRTSSKSKIIEAIKKEGADIPAIAIRRENWFENELLL